MYVGKVGALVALFCWNVACDSTNSPLQPGPDSTAASFVVSDAAPAGLAELSASYSSSSFNNTYVSLPPGAIPGAVAATIHTRGSVSMNVTFIGGGFDPVAVPANAGDSITIAVRTQPAAQPLLFVLVVPFKKAPTVVRTNPTRAKRDVALNSRMIAIFSEPIDPASLTDNSIQLRKDGTVVPGRLAFGDAAHTSVEFTPAAVLDNITDYEFVITKAVRDLDATQLDSAVVVPFSTSSGSEPPVQPLTVARSTPTSGQRFVSIATAEMEIWFSERFVYSTMWDLVTPRIRLETGSNTLTGSYTCVDARDGTCSSLLLRPAVALLQSTDYRLIIDPGLTGVSGGVLPSQVTIPFTTASTPQGGLTTAPFIRSFQMIEFQYNSAHWYYAPLVQVFETSGVGSTHIKKIVLTIPGITGEAVLCPHSLRIDALGGRDLFTEIYGDYQITFSAGLQRASAGEATVTIDYTDAQGRRGTITARTTVTAGALPATYTGGNPATTYSMGPACN